MKATHPSSTNSDQIKSVAKTKTIGNDVDGEENGHKNIRRKEGSGAVIRNRKAGKYMIHRLRKKR